MPNQNTMTCDEFNTLLDIHNQKVADGKNILRVQECTDLGVGGFYEVINAENTQCGMFEKTWGGEEGKRQFVETTYSIGRHSFIDSLRKGKVLPCVPSPVEQQVPPRTSLLKPCLFNNGKQPSSSSWKIDKDFLDRFATVHLPGSNNGIVEITRFVAGDPDSNADSARDGTFSYWTYTKYHITCVTHKVAKELSEIHGLSLEKFISDTVIGYPTILAKILKDLDAPSEVYCALKLDAPRAELKK